MTRYIIRNILGDNKQRGRKRAGIILGGMGIFFDLLLFGIKSVAGILSGSVAITADAYNNLTDAGAHILALLAFPLGDKKPSRRFPLGLGRLEYLSGLLIAVAILTVGIKMLIPSFEKIIRPRPVESSTPVILILLFSIAVKAYMYSYNKRIGEKICSAGLRSVAIDSVCDCLATGTIILSIIVQHLTGICIDGWTGLLVALCIIGAGIIAIKDSILPLLGIGMDEDVKDQLYGILEVIPRLHTVESLYLHDYGPNRKIVTMRLTGSVDSDTVEALHHRIKKQLHMEAVIEISNFQSKSNNSGQSRQE